MENGLPLFLLSCWGSKKFTKLSNYIIKTLNNKYKFETTMILTPSHIYKLLFFPPLRQSRVRCQWLTNHFLGNLSLTLRLLCSCWPQRSKHIINIYLDGFSQTEQTHVTIIWIKKENDAGTPEAPLCSLPVTLLFCHCALTTTPYLPRLVLPVYGLLCLGSLTQHFICKIQYISHFNIVSYCVTLAPFIYPFYCWWAFG